MHIQNPPCVKFYFMYDPSSVIFYSAIILSVFMLIFIQLLPSQLLLPVPFFPAIMIPAVSGDKQEEGCCLLESDA